MTETNAGNRATDAMAEMAEFILNDQSFAINGSKIKEIVLYDQAKVTEPPFDHPSVVGVYLYRGRTLPLIDLKSYLELPHAESIERPVVVVTEFNEMATAFIADKVNRIHRLKWSDLTPMDSFLVRYSPQLLGTVKIEDREMLILDLEQIVGELFPHSVTNYKEQEFQDKPVLEKRAKATVFFAEDSFVIRTQLQKIFKSLGYGKVTSFEHGRAALEAILALKEASEQEGKPLTDNLSLIISDIEMPQMDGLTLCRTLKHDLGLKVPMILFSSLINEQIAAKCRAAGADDFVSKPQTDLLIEKMDRMCLD